ncbi:S1 RNA-binding domain-containing protein [Micromonospora sp. NPDC047074]|uniref:S1 RNA-binding domain-containing protein n=1 Tax=Micromonospora sp. NPDC047074 TaxID=3154339 RepID=UPI0033F86BC1
MTVSPLMVREAVAEDRHGTLTVLATGLVSVPYISQMADHRVEHPSEVVNVGETVTVQILDVDIARERVSLSLKARPPPALNRAGRDLSRQPRPRRHVVPADAALPGCGLLSGSGRGRPANGAA